MDEINEQTENMKQIQEALSAPIGAAADFDEVLSWISYLFFFFLILISVLYFMKILVIFDNGRMNWRQNLKNWKALSWKSSFFSLQPLPPLHQFMSLHQLADYQLGLLLRSKQLRKMNLLHCKQKWHFEQRISMQYFY